MNENVVLRDGEIAILESGTRIMNVNTYIELEKKLEIMEEEEEREEIRKRGAAALAAYNMLNALAGPRS